MSSTAGICWLYACKLRGRCGEWEWEGGGAGGLGGTAELVLVRGGGAETCRNAERREQTTLEFRYVQAIAYLCACVICVCVCVFVSYTGGSAGDRAVYVSHGFQDVEGNKSNLVEAITTLPPALG